MLLPTGTMKNQPIAFMNAMIVLEDMCPDLKVAAGKWAAEAIMRNYLIERESYAIKKTAAEAEAVAADSESESDSDATVADIDSDATAADSESESESESDSDATVVDFPDFPDFSS